MNKWIAICIALGSAFPTPFLQAQTWPQRPVKVIVPYTAGGTTDTQARIVSERLSVALGQRKIKMLAVTGEKRMPQLPDLPAIAEFYPGFRTVVWNGLLAPSRTPKAIIDRIAQEVAKVARDPGIIERLNKMGIDALGNSPAEFAELIRADSSLWRDAVNAAGIKQE